MVETIQNSWTVMNGNYHSRSLGIVLMNPVHRSWVVINGIFKPNTVTVQSRSVLSRPVPSRLFSREWQSRSCLLKHPIAKKCTFWRIPVSVHACPIMKCCIFILLYPDKKELASVSFWYRPQIGATTFSITAFNIMTLSITTNKTQHSA